MTLKFTNGVYPLARAAASSAPLATVAATSAPAAYVASGQPALPGVAESVITVGQAAATSPGSETGVASGGASAGGTPAAAPPSAAIAVLPKPVPSVPGTPFQWLVVLALGAEVAVLLGVVKLRGARV
ncbi:MAG: hypothetical protein ACYDGR_09305 [Candidatus Dormibacteria bacterium]